MNYPDVNDGNVEDYEFIAGEVLTYKEKRKELRNSMLSLVGLVVMLVVVMFALIIFQ